MKASIGMLTVKKPLTEDECICYVVGPSWPQSKPLSTLDKQEYADPLTL